MAVGDKVLTTDYTTSKSKATAAITKVSTTFSWTNSVSAGATLTYAAVRELMNAVDKAYDLLVLGTTRVGCSSHNSANRAGYSNGCSNNYNCSDSCEYCYWCSSNNGYG